MTSTGGGKDYFPPDKVLDQVATLLGNTCTGFTVEFRGDAVEIDSVVLDQNVENMTKEYVVVDRDGVIGGECVGVIGDAKRKFKLEKEITKTRVQRENALKEYVPAKKKKKTDVEME